MSPKRRSRSSTWSMPKSPGRRSCSWSKGAEVVSNKTDTVQSTSIMEQETANKEAPQTFHLENITSD